MNKKALHKISYGLYVICSGAKGKCNGQIANVVFQITSEPPTVAVSINKKNYTHELIQKNKNFTVSVLSKETPMELIGCFGFKCGREFDKFQKVSTMTGVTGAPVITDHTLAYIEAEVISSLDVGTHTVFVGNIVDADIIREGEPMTYAYYQDIKRGKAPENAPTYIKEDAPKSSGTGTMKKYRCTVCGYIYDPEAGDPDSGIAPGTPFEKLPDTWVCPVCGADKSVFVIEG